MNQVSSPEEYGEDTFPRQRSPETDYLSDFIGSLSPESATGKRVSGGFGENEESSDIERKGVPFGGREKNGLSDRRERKRNRTSEMHNLTERRRRGRIKEKLNALQELIPNAQKLDRASLLDEAISYVKSLQLQLQIISRASSTYQMPHLSPAALQYLQMSQISPLSPMGSTLCPPMLTFPSALQSINWVQMVTQRLNPACTFHPSLPSPQVPSVPSVEISAASPGSSVSVQTSKQQPFDSMNNSDHQPIHGSVVDAQDFQCCSQKTREDEIEQHGLVEPDNSELVTNLEKTNL